MATSSEVVRAGLATITTAALVDITAEAADAPLERRTSIMLESLPLVVPAYYDATGALAVAWYDELRSEASPSTLYTPEIVGDPTTDWIEREAATFRRSLDGLDFEVQVAAMAKEISRLAEKEVARGFRDTILGNTRQDEDSIGWSRVARSGACRLCVMIAARGAVFRESTANFATHKSCHCAARPELRNGTHGPEATPEQYLASTKRRTPAQQKQLRAYLNENYPDARG